MTCYTNIKGDPKQNQKLPFSLAALKFCSSVRHQPSRLNLRFRLRINTFLDGKILLLLHQKTALCCMSNFFHVMMKQPRLEQTQTRCVPGIFKIRLKLFEAGNQLNAGALSQSALSNHALLITKSALVINKKCPLSQPISFQ